MTLRFKTESALCVALAAVLCSTSAIADSGYYPYYEDGRDAYQFSTVTGPITNGVPSPTPPSAPQTNFKSPADNIRAHDATLAPPTLMLGTRSGLDGALQGDYYNYDENKLGEQISGPQLGVDLAATVVAPNHIFDTLDLAYSYGTVNYRDPVGNSGDHTNETWEIRDTVGQDFIWQRYSLSPFIGLGYRNLYNDSTGANTFGISTLSQYLYIPIGVKPEVRIDGANIIRMNAEFDYLGDNGDGDPTVHNGQGAGLGFRGEAMWDTGTWAFGPFIQYWSVPNSDGAIFHSPNSTCGAATCVGTAPHSTTVEGGIQLRYHFLDF
jgi:hypothetical protein